MKNQFSTPFIDRCRKVVEKNQKDFEKAKTLVGCLWIFSILCGVIFWGILGYVIYHFIMKLW